MTGDKTDQGGDVEDQRDVAAAQDGRAADQAQVGEHAPERLDDGLELSHQLVDDDAGALAAELNDHQAFPRGGRRLDLEQVAQADEGQGFTAQVEIIPLGAQGPVFDAFDDGVERDDVGVVVDADQEAVDDRQRQRQPDGEGRSPAFVRNHLDAAAQGLDVASHHIHADAAPRKVGNLVGGGEAGLEDQVDDFAVAERGIGRDQLAFDGFGADALAIEAAAVVGDFDDDAAGVVEGIERDPARGRFSPFAPQFGGFDAVVERVADEVHQRVADFLDDGFIEFGLAAVDDEFDVLAQFLGNVADDPVEAVVGTALVLSR